MRRTVHFIFVTAALLGTGMIVASFFHQRQTVLLRRHTADDAYQFLVADHGTLLVARQKLVPIVPSARGDASEFAKLQMKFAAFDAPGVHANFGTMTIAPFADVTSRHPFFAISFGPVVLGNGSVRVQFAAAGAPMWAVGAVLMLPLALSGAWAARSHVFRSRRIRRGLCAKCGYDLRASGEFCPECGGANPAWRGALTAT
jgi:hypothetical protein